MHLATKKRSNSISTGVLLIGLSILFMTNYWWPGILLAIGASLATRQYLRGRLYDLMLTILIWGGLFAVFAYQWDTVFLAPVVLMVAGLYLIFREFFVRKFHSKEEIAEDVSREVEEKEKNE